MKIRRSRSKDLLAETFFDAEQRQPLLARIIDDFSDREPTKRTLRKELAAKRVVERLHRLENPKRTPGVLDLRSEDLVIGAKVVVVSYDPKAEKVNGVRPLRRRSLEVVRVPYLACENYEKIGVFEARLLDDEGHISTATDATQSEFIRLYEVGIAPRPDGQYEAAHVEPFDRITPSMSELDGMNNLPRPNYFTYQRFPGEFTERDERYAAHDAEMDAILTQSGPPDTILH